MSEISGIRRRTLTSSAAWTVPVVAVAVAAPLAAASTGVVTASISQHTFHVNQNHLNITTVFQIDGRPITNATFTVSIADRRFTFDGAGGSGGSHYGVQSSSTGASGSFTGAVKIDEAKGTPKADVNTTFVFTVHLSGGATVIVSVPVTITHDNRN